MCASYRCVWNMNGRMSLFARWHEFSNQSRQQQQQQQQQATQQEVSQSAKSAMLQSRAFAHFSRKFATLRVYSGSRLFYASNMWQFSGRTSQLCRFCSRVSLLCCSCFLLFCRRDEPRPITTCAGFCLKIPGYSSQSHRNA